jgi:hypothetical protein
MRIECERLFARKLVDGAVVDVLVGGKTKVMDWIDAEEEQKAMRSRIKVILRSGTRGAEWCGIMG